MRDRRSVSQAEAEEIPDELALEAKQQLESEISILQGWVNDLKETREDNQEAIIARKFYTEMIQNRRELLDTINAQ